MLWYLNFLLSSQYSDLAEAERALIFEKFRQLTMRWNQSSTVQSNDEHDIAKEEQKSHMIVVTDACLPLLASGESPITARLLINYELPAKKVHNVFRLHLITVLSIHLYVYFFFSFF